MPIPEFNEIKAPALQFFIDGKAHKVSEVYAALAPHFNLTEADLNEILPSGNQRRWENHANWACYDLFRAGLLDRPKRGHYIITDVIYLQAKRWEQTVGRKEIQSFVGALAGQQAHKGVFITTSDFADTATVYAKKVPQKVILIDGDRLADIMIQHNIGVSRSHAYEVKHIDGDRYWMVCEHRLLDGTTWRGFLPFASWREF